MHLVELVSPRNAYISMQEDVNIKRRVENRQRYDTENPV